MEVSVEWIYFVLTAPFVAVWALLSLYAPHLRREQVRTSIVFACIGVLLENLFYFKDYWHPQSIFPIDLGVFMLFPEALLFGGVFGGIAAVGYRAIFHVREQSRDSAQSGQRTFIAAVMFLAASYALFLSGINSIYAHAYAALLLAVYIAIRRPDLRGMSLGSGVLTLGVMFVCYSLVWVLVTNMEQLLATTWLLYDTPLDVRISGIPLTELVWGFAVGASAGVIRAYIKNIRYA